MNGSILAESLVAMTGIFPTRGPSDLAIRGAMTYPERIRRRLVKFLAGEQAEPMKWEPPPLQTDLWQDLNTPLDPEKLVEWLDGVLPDMQLGYRIVIEAAHGYIRDKWPIYSDTSLGVHNPELAADEYGDVWHICRTLDDPETLFDDLDSLILLPEQVEAFAAVYPALFEEVRGLAIALLQPFMEVHGLADKRKSLRWDREEQIRVLLQLPQDAPIEPQTNGTDQTKPGKGEATSEETPSEHLAAKRVAEK